jgi:hypothetical protein
MGAAATGCPVCGGAAGAPFYRVDGAPTNSCLIRDTAAAARACARGTIELVGCAGCGFVFNRAFRPELTEYSERYISSQASSGTFNAFQTRLAQRIGAHFGLRAGEVVEVGCGEGDFLPVLVAVLGLERGVGVDPAAPASDPPDAPIRFVRSRLTPELAATLTADLVVCKMTLEHVPELDAFTAALARLAASRPHTGLFVSVPASERIFADHAFWDVYYEHCNYFTRRSLRTLLERHGFTDVRAETLFGGQYLAAFARRGDAAPAPTPGTSVADRDDFSRFADVARERVATWAALVERHRARGERVVLWGSGSKAVAFLTALPDADAVDCVVDINPARQGQFVAGTGHPIIAPADLTARRPGLVVVMNPNYDAEIRRALDELGVRPRIIALD